MKPVSEALMEHIASTSATLCTCWKLTLMNGALKCFTDFDENLVIEDLTYLSAAGYKRTAVSISLGLSADNLDVEGMLTSEAITENDLLSGLYDYAKIEIFVVNYKDLSMGKIPLVTGRIGEIATGRNGFSAQLTGLNQAYSQTYGQVYAPECKAFLGDNCCKKELTNFTHQGTVSAVTNNRLFTASNLISFADGYFNWGNLTWTSGANSGLSMEIKDFNAEAFVLQLPMPYPIAVNDNFIAIAGCDKKLTTCRTKFANAINFQGFPFVPGVDKMLEVGGR